MMRLVKYSLVGAILLVIGAGLSSAQSGTRNLPAEFPPGSYQGKQYVDSKGCVFIRAGAAGNTVWVPRKSRAGKSICGMRPTFAGRRGTQSRPSASAGAATATGITVIGRPIAGASQTSRPQVRRQPATAQRKPAPATRVEIRPRRQVTRSPAPARNPVPGTGRGQVASNCWGGTSHPKQAGLRCAPQSKPYANHAAIAKQRQARQQHRTNVQAYGKSRKHGHILAPEGYKPVWRDDRLNPYRGGTAWQQ